MSSNEKWFVITCDSNFKVTDIHAFKNLALDIKVDDQISKIISYDSLSNFLDFTINLRHEKVLFSSQMCVREKDQLLTYMDFGGMQYEDQYIITAFTNCFEIYEELISINDEQTNALKEKIKYTFYPMVYQEFTKLNNEAINLQRELYKKNAYIQVLLNESNEMNQKLEVSNAAKDRIFSIIGHDLRTPLSNIIGSVNLIANDKLTYEELLDENFFDKLKDSAGNAMILLENLLEWSKSQLSELSYFPTNFNLLESISADINLLKDFASVKRIHVSEVLLHNPHVYADSRMISVVVRNLLSNAIKFTKEDGELIIRVNISKQFAIFTIIDNGIGISKENIDNLFDIEKHNVVRGTTGEKGTGFGLILCKHLIEQNGGSLSIYSQLDKGSNFSFSIPLSE